jgi:hypothetical protein
MTSPASREGVQLLDAFGKIDAAGPLAEMPAVVLSADKPWRTDLLPDEAKQVETVTFDDWLAAQDRLADALGGRHLRKTESGHAVNLYSPKLVVDAIRDVVDEVRER